MHRNDDGRQRSRTTMRHHSDYSKPGDNMHTYGNDEEIAN